MSFKIVSAAVLAAVLGATAANAQSVSRIGGPANPPPAGFTGQQFVDNRGCVFLKAGYGGQTNWVPRVGRDRKVMCGFPPTGTTSAPIEVATAAEMAKPAAEAASVAAKPVMAELAPVMPVAPVKAAPKVSLQAPAPRVVTLVPAVPAAPVIKAAPLVVAAPRQPAPYVEVAPRGTYEVAQAAGPSRGQVGCFSSAPVAERVKLRNGGTAVVCTRGDGTLTGWRPPIYPRNAGVGAALTDPVMAQGKATHSGGMIGDSQQGAVVDNGQAYARASKDAIPTPPKGYKLAWTDDRLNPNRGKGTAEGWAQQDQVWTRKVPAQLVEDQPAVKRKKKVVYVQSGSNVVVSTKGQAATAPVQKKVAKAAKAAKGGAYIQVGTFGVPSNADGAAARLKGAGLPVARAKITSGGKAMQIVLAGPFGSAADAQTALSMARQAGFGDAFIR